MILGEDTDEAASILLSRSRDDQSSRLYTERCVRPDELFQESLCKPYSGSCVSGFCQQRCSESQSYICQGVLIVSHALYNFGAGLAGASKIKLRDLRGDADPVDQCLQSRDTRKFPASPFRARQSSKLIILQSASPGPRHCFRRRTRTNRDSAHS